MSHDSGDYKQSVDLQEIFEENYKEARACGKSHIEAKNEAIDYYRKYTSREIYNIELGQFPANEDSLELIDKIGFNNFISLILDNLQGTEQKMFACFIIALNQDQILSDAVHERISSITSYVPKTDIMAGGLSEIAMECGYKPAKDGYYNCLYRLRSGIKSVLLKKEMKEYINVLKHSEKFQNVIAIIGE